MTDLFAAHRHVVTRAVQSLRPRQPADADDLTQDGLVALWRATQTWPGEGDFAAYAYPRVRGAMIDGLRSRTGRKLRPEMCQLVGDLADVAPGPEREVIARDELARVVAWMGTLPPHVAAAVKAHREGGSVSRLAARCGVVPTTISQRRRVALDAYLAA